MGKRPKETKDGPSLLLERVQAERDLWCLVVRDSATDEAQQVFLDYCSHKSIPLGPKAALTKKGQIRCPHHDVCFDCASGAVTDGNGKKVPQGLVPVAFARAADRSIDERDTEDTEDTDEKLTLMITPEHRAYLGKTLQKLDKSRKSSTKTRRKEQNHAGDLNKTND